MSLMSGGKGGGKNALASKPNLLNALQVQTSSYGQVIPILYGQNRIAGRLLWSGDFQAIAHTSTQKVGGKGLGSGSGNVSQTSYTYQTAVAIALCLGPIQNIGSVWDTKGLLTLLSTSAQFTVPSGGGSFTPSIPSGGVWHSGRGVARQDAYNLNPNDYGSDGAVSLSGSQLTPMVLVGSNPGAGQYSLSSTGQHTFSSADAGKVMTITYAYSEPTSNSPTGAPATVLNLTLFLGQRPQTPWAYLTSAHFGQDLGYNGIAYIASSAMDLGSSGALPNLSYEVLGLLPFGGGITDAEPGAIINDLLTNPFYGLGSQGNLILDPGILSVALSGAYWTQSDILFAKGYGTFFFTGTGSPSGFHAATTKPIFVTPGQQYSLSGYVDARQVSTGNSGWYIFDPTITTRYLGVEQVPGTSGVVSGTWTCPAGVTQVVILCDTNNTTINNGQPLRFARPMFSLGAIPNTQVMLDDYTNFSSYCIANGILLSPVYDSQQTAAKCIQDILDVTNAEAVWSEGVLKIRSYGDTTAVGNGVIFSPNTSPIYDLDSNSYLDVVTVKRPSVADIMNSVSVEFVDRTNSYNVAVAEDKDEAQIAIYGLRKAQPKTAHSITSAGVAAFVANLLRKRQVEVRNTYTVKVGWQYALLEPMDLVTLTIPELGYTKKPVRILSIREDDTGQIELECEDFPWGTATPTLYTQQVPTRFSPQTNADPGVVNPPIVFEAPVGLSKSGQHEIWMAVSGQNINWGGCSVWVSQDNSEYHQVGKIFNPARMGVCGGTGTFGITGDPYTGVVNQTWDLTQSRGVLTAGTQQDADSYRTLVYFDGEFMSYAGLTLVSSNVYNPQGYIRRGLFGSVITTHNLGSPVARLDDAIFAYVYDPAFLGKTIYLKFTSFNTNGLVEQSIANATAYQFIVTGKYCQMETVSKNLLANPGFDSNQVKTPINTDIFTYQGRITDNWVVGTPNLFAPSAGLAPFVSTGGHSSASTLFLINRIYGPITLQPNNFFVCDVCSDPIPITPGETYAWGGWCWLNPEGFAFPTSGWGARGEFDLRLYDASGTYLAVLATGVTGCTAMRLITENNPQGWQFLSNYGAVPLATTAGVNAASNSGVPAFARVDCSYWYYNQSGSAQSIPGMISCFYDDAFLFPQWSPTGDEINKFGSMAPSFAGAISYASDTGSITWSWNLTVYRTDRTQSQNNFNSSQKVSGLSSGSTYQFYPFIDEVNQVFNMVATGGVGSPSWAHNGVSVLWSQEQCRGDHTPLSNTAIAASTTTSGTGGGSGGGGGGPSGVCLRSDCLVQEKTRGVIRLENLRVGDWIRCPVADDTPQGWAAVLISESHFNPEWIHVHFSDGDWLPSTPGHGYTLADGATTRAALLSTESQIPCLTGIVWPVKIELVNYPAKLVRLVIASKAHTYYAGMTEPSKLNHNFVLES